MEISIIVERGFALAYFICGLSLLFNTRLWIDFIGQLSKSKSTIMLGFMTVFIGSFMAMAHNIWEMSPRVLTTVLAWAAVFKGTSFLLTPELMLNMTQLFRANKMLLQTGGLLAMALSIFIYYYSWPH